MPSETAHSTHGAARRRSSRPVTARLPARPVGAAARRATRPGRDGGGDGVAQARGDLVQVDLGAQPRGEGLHRAGGVVAGPVEPPVDRAPAAGAGPG